MRPTTFICALAATLQLLSGTAFAGGWTWPIRGPVITTYRNGDDPYAAGQHRGVDIAAPVGTRVVAATGGTVTFAGVVGSAGLVVSERSADGRFDLSYLHLSSATVHRGDQVAEGAAVGAVGTSGRRSAEQPHLHFGVREAGQRSAYRDPLDFLSAPPIADRPGPAPAPVPVGAPAAADPSPAPAAPSPAPTPAHAPMPSPTRGPVPEPEHIPALPLGPPIPALLPSRALAGGADPHGAPYGRHAPDLGSLPQILAPSVGPHPRTGTDPHEPARAQHGAAAGRATASTGPGGAPSAPHAPGPAAATPAHRAGAKKHGINLGWLAACIGLIALATVLGHPPGSRRADVRRRRPAGGRPLPPDKTTAASKTSRACSAARHRPTLAAILRPAQRGGSTR